MKCVFLDRDTLGSDIDTDQLKQFMDIKFFPNTKKRAADIIQRIEGAEALISNKVPITRDVIENSPHLKVIFTAATGVDHIDINACNDRQIPVCNTRNYAGSSVVQHVFASILYFANQQHTYNQSILDKTWSSQELFCLFSPPVSEIKGKKLGIVGYGNLGKKVEQIANAFEMEVLISQSRTSNKKDGRKPFESVLQESDFISIHCPLTPETRFMFNLETLGMMKPTSYLINTARGDVVNTMDLVHALDQNYIAGASLDVFNQEPLPQDHHLLTPRDNLLLTPHIAWASHEARQRLLQELVFNIEAWLSGNTRNKVN